MPICLNAVGFVFDKVKTYIKIDKSCKYTNYYCQDCIFGNKKDISCSDVFPGTLKPCNNCSNNTQYKICIFKLKKDHFISSSLNISTSFEDAWEQFKSNIIYQKNGNFVISLGDCNGGTHSFYANLIKTKKCTCCDSVLLYFKYNIITMLTGYQEQQLSNPPPDIFVPTSSNFPYSVACANLSSNITYKLRSGEYKNVRFFISSEYQFSNSLEPYCT